MIRNRIIREKELQKKVNPAIWVLLVVYIVLSQIVTQLFDVEASRISGIILMVPIVMMLIVTVIMSHWKVKITLTKYHKYILFWGLFCLLSSIWAESPELALSKGVDIIEIFIIMFIVSFCIQDNDSVDTILKAIMWAYYAIIIYEILFYGWDYFVLIMKDSSRVSSEFLNSNTLGMCASFAIVINIYLVLSKKISLWSLALAVISIVVIAASGSRKALLALIAGVFLLFLFRGLRKNQRNLPFLKFLIGLPIVIFIAYLIFQMPMFSGIMERIEGMIAIITGGFVEKSAMIRMSLVELGIELFKEHPILGIGMDNPRLYTYAVVRETYYLHNNYVEILAGGGLVGIIIYYSVYIKLLISYIKHRNFDDLQYCICFVLLLLTLILDYGMVSYYSKSTFILLLLFVKLNEKIKYKKISGDCL